MRNPNPRLEGRTALVVVALLLVATGLVLWFAFPSAAPTKPVGETNGEETRTSTTDTVVDTATDKPSTTEGDAKREFTPEELALRAELQSLLDQLSYNPEDLSKPLAAQKLRELEEEIRNWVAGLHPSQAGIVLDLLAEETDFKKRWRLIEGLSLLGGDVAARGLSDHYRWAMDADKIPEGQLVIDALIDIDNDVAFTFFDEQAHFGREKHRFRFIDALGQHSRRNEAVPYFLDVLDDPQAGDRQRNRAAKSLKAAAPYTAAPDIEKKLDREESKYVRQTMIGALGAIGDPNSLAKLEQIAKNDPELGTRLSAINAIHRIGTTKAKDILGEIAEKDPADRVRRDAKKHFVDLEASGL